MSHESLAGAFLRAGHFDFPNAVERFRNPTPFTVVGFQKPPEIARDNAVTGYLLDATAHH